MTAPESDPRTATRPAATSHQGSAAGTAPKRTLDECVNDILAYIGNRFGNPSDWEQLIVEFNSLIPTTTRS
ncbi:MAG TPA: hypothetical protein VKH81_03875 [Candidatus Angelobacter sp.]|nr:hypothetical protein [Candidatus Angelobacter sp.]